MKRVPSGPKPRKNLLLTHVLSAGFESYSDFARKANFNRASISNIAVGTEYAGVKFFTACNKYLNLSDPQMKYLIKKFGNPRNKKKNYCY